MSTSPETRQTLLLRIRDSANVEAWCEFVDLYAPIIHAYGRKRGLQDADAADLAQRTLQSVAGAIPKFDYDSNKGTFRGWLFTITRNHYLKMLQTQAREITGSGNSGVARLLEQLPDESLSESDWDLEYEAGLLDVAMQNVESEFQTSTWQAFRLSTFDAQEPKQIAAALGMSVGAVYIARSRVKSRLREYVSELDSH